MSEEPIAPVAGEDESSSDETIMQIASAYNPDAMIETVDDAYEALGVENTEQPVIIMPGEEGGQPVVVRPRERGSVLELGEAVGSIPSFSGVAAKEVTASEQVEELYDEDRLAAMRELLREHYLRIVQQILASDTGALSPKEVAFRNEGIIAESTVRDHLHSLHENGYIEKLEPEVDTIPNTIPRTFYAASEFTIDLLKELGLWENLGMLYQIYDVLERPDDIKAIEDWDERPVPDWIE